MACWKHPTGYLSRYIGYWWILYSIQDVSILHTGYLSLYRWPTMVETSWCPVVSHYNWKHRVCLDLLALGFADREPTQRPPKLEELRDSRGSNSCDLTHRWFTNVALNHEYHGKDLIAQCSPIYYLVSDTTTSESIDGCALADQPRNGTNKQSNKQTNN